MKTSLRLLLSALIICTFGITNSKGKGYIIPVHDVSINKYDEDSTVESLQLTNLDSTGIMNIHWQILNDGFSLSGWTYTFCDLAQCYVTSYPKSATDPLVPKTNGAFVITVQNFNHEATSAIMQIKIWDASDPNHPDTVNMSINGTLMGINNSIIPSSFVAVFPNPATNYINLEANLNSFQPIKAIIFNSLGKTISEQNISGSTNRLPVYDLPYGIYIISLRDQYGRETRKQFVKE